MNITEANAFHSLLRGLRTDASADDRARAIEATADLTNRARKALNAGPYPDETLPLVNDVIDAVEIAADEGLLVELGQRPITTTTPAGGVL